MPWGWMRRNGVFERVGGLLEDGWRMVREFEVAVVAGKLQSKTRHFRKACVGSCGGKCEVKPCVTGGWVFVVQLECSLVFLGVLVWVVAEVVAGVLCINAPK